MESRVKTTFDEKELESLISGSKVLLLRHANSQQNYEFDELKKRTDCKKEELKLRLKRDLRDAPLSTLGVEQWENSQSLANQLKVEIVCLSPLRRAMETAYHVFKNHPNFQNIKFIVLLKLKEAIDTACDLPVNILDVVEEYKSKFPNLDVSDLEKYEDVKHYYLSDIEDEFAKTILSTKIAKAEDPCGSNAFDLALEYIRHTNFNHLESNNSIINRVTKARNQVSDILKESNFGDDSKLVIVAHSYYFKMWTGSWAEKIEEYDVIPEPEKSVWLNNCQFIADNAHFPKILI